MFRQIIARISGSIAALAAFIVLTASTALAENSPGLGEGSGSAPAAPPSPPPFEVFGISWQLALAIGVALIAVIGLAVTVEVRRHGHHASGQHA